MTLDHAGVGVFAIDGDLVRLERFRHFAHQVEMQQPVFEARTCHLDVIGKLETALERARGDAVMQIPRLFAFAAGNAAADHQDVGLHRHLQVVLLEPGHGHADAIGVIAQLFDIIGRKLGRGVPVLRLVEQAVEAVEPDAGAKQGRKVESSHVISSIEQYALWARHCAARLHGAEPERGIRRCP